MPDPSRYPEHFALDIPIESATFVVFDTELTGLNPRRDHIVSIGAVTIRCLQIIPHDSFYSVVKPRDSIVSDATFVHRITPEDLVMAPCMEEVLSKFVEFCGNSILVGHQLEIDLPFLRKAFSKCLHKTIPNLFIDTVRLARCCKKKIRDAVNSGPSDNISYNLRRLSRLLELPMFPQHDALGDAIQTAYLFLKLISMLRADGISSPRDLCVMSSPSWLQACRVRWGMKKECRT